MPDSSAFRPDSGVVETASNLPETSTFSPEALHELPNALFVGIGNENTTVSSKPIWRRPVGIPSKRGFVFSSSSKSPRDHPCLKLRNTSKYLPNEFAHWVVGVVASMVDENLSPNRVRNVFNVTSGLLRGAVAYGIIRVNPAGNVELPKAQKNEQRYLTPDQISSLADEVNPLYRTMILTLGVSGLRIGEASALRRRSIDVIGKRIHVFEAVAKVQSPGQPGEWITGTPKSGKDRHVAIPRHLALALNNQLTCYSGPADDLAFTTSTGNRVTAAYFGNHILKPALVRANLDPQIRTHDLRHSAAAAMIRANPNPELVKRQLGHSTIQVTFDLYGHLFPDEADRLAEALEGVWNASQADQRRTMPLPDTISMSP